MEKRHIRGLLLGLFAAGATQVAWAEDPTINRLLAAQCAQCHGTNGHAVGDIDSLHDEGFKDLYEDLMDMRSEDRPEDIMDHQALGYTDDQIRRIAQYFGSRSGQGGDIPETGGNGGNDGPTTGGGEEEESEKKSERKRSKREKTRRERREDDD